MNHGEDKEVGEEMRGVERGRRDRMMSGKGDGKVAYITF